MQGSHLELGCHGEECEDEGEVEEGAPAYGGGRAGGLLLRRDRAAGPQGSLPRGGRGRATCRLPSTRCCSPAAGSQEGSLDATVRRFSTGVSS